jgi:hypothetical protein
MHDNKVAAVVPQKAGVSRKAGRVALNRAAITPQPNHVGCQCLRKRERYARQDKPQQYAFKESDERHSQHHNEHHHTVRPAIRGFEKDFPHAFSEEDSSKPGEEAAYECPRHVWHERREKGHERERNQCDAGTDHSEGFK